LNSGFTFEDFRGFIAQGKFMAVKCGDCNHMFIPPKPICPYCGSGKLSWIEVSRVGRVVSYTEVHVPLKGFEGFTPYVVALVEFEGGFRLPGIVKNVKVSDLRVGLNVVLEFSRDFPSGYFFHVYSCS